jgi:hypothetical protein
MLYWGCWVGGGHRLPRLDIRHNPARLSLGGGLSSPIRLCFAEHGKTKQFVAWPSSARAAWRCSRLNSRAWASLRSRSARMTVCVLPVSEHSAIFSPLTEVGFRARRRQVSVNPGCRGLSGGRGMVTGARLSAGRFAGGSGEESAAVVWTTPR